MWAGGEASEVTSQTLRTIQDVKKFLRSLLCKLGTDFDINKDFTEYTTLTASEAILFNRQMALAFLVCSKYNQDLYQIAERVKRQHASMGVSRENT